ncbi:hypothetical protein L596_000972 [Steinernema carpocapsae]|uniref:Uncharacterized protein n=1 Tax=Steinernema carpocapsae TaxID=34508 RepID=A0A4U8ULZ7_STECR|nr:hypothetical protein L596_000972 [Steinernema carpocapsae]
MRSRIPDYEDSSSMAPVKTTSGREASRSKSPVKGNKYQQRDSKEQLPTIRTDEFEYKHWGATEAIQARSDVKELLVIGKANEKVKIEATVAPQITSDPLPRPKLTGRRSEKGRPNVELRRRRIVPLTQGLHALPTTFGAVISGTPLTLPSPKMPEKTMMIQEVQDPTRPLATEEELEKAVEANWTPDPDIKAAGSKQGTRDPDQRRGHSGVQGQHRLESRWILRAVPVERPTRRCPEQLRHNCQEVIQQLGIPEQEARILDKYHAIFMDQLEKGMIEVVDPGIACESRVHYLPHQAVLTPIRLRLK